MAAIQVDPSEGERLAAMSGGKLSLAAVNAPRSVVLSGDTAALKDVIAALATRGIEHKMLPVNYAFHSAQMEPYRAQLEAALVSLAPKAARTALYSTVTGERLDGRAMDARYWGRNMRDAVRFAPAVAALARDGYKLFLEIAPHPVLAWGIEAVLAEHGGGTVASSLRRGRPERVCMLEALGQLYTHGAAVDWNAVQRGGQRVSLPHYPWQRSRFWVTLPARVEMAVQEDGTSHPLLGRRIESPALTGTVFESVWSAEAPAFLGEHSVAGGVIVSATAIVELALAAAGEWKAIRDVVFIEPLRLSEGPRRVQVVLAPEGDAFAIFSRPVDADSGEWTRHASGRQVPASVECPSTLALAEVRARCEHAVDAATLYAGFADVGLRFGPAFQGIACASFSSSEAVAEIATPDVLLDSVGCYRFHPALLDACIQPCTELLRRDGSALAAGEVFLPLGLDSFDLWAAPSATLWTHVKLRSVEGEGHVRIADIDVRDATGNAVASVRGLRLRRVQLATLGAKFEARLYIETWQSAPNASAPRSLAGTRWLLNADAPELAQALAERLAEAEASCVMLVGDDSAALRQQVSAELDCGGDGVIQLCGPDAARLSDVDEASLQAGCRRTTGNALALIQGVLCSSAPATPLWFVTRGARFVREGDTVDPLQAGPWGLARAAELEHPELPLRRVDLDPSAPGDELDHLLHELARPGDAEAEAAWRGEGRFSPRLMRAGPTAAPHAAPSWRLEAASTGSLDGLVRRPAPRLEPAAGEVEIEVRAAGLNFRDVLSALGMYPGAAGPLGGECAGVVCRLGPGVTNLSVGDEVMAFARASFASHVVARVHCVARRPATLSMAEAASTPIAFLTAKYALERLAKLRCGERVLIHAGAGGVGLAAVQVALHLGAEVFATAGNPAKRRFLKGLGVRHVLDSRSLDFAQAIRSVTRGDGVHVVLNALSGEFISASVASLATGGRFVEMGKRDIWTTERMRSVRSDASYFPFDLGDAADGDPTLVPGLFAELGEHLASGALRPLPVSAFSFEHAEEAFRTMAQARHIGKVVLTAEAVRRLAIDSLACYLVTGGHGALGQHVARWLADRGAKHVVLTGRRAPPLENAGVMAELAARGVRVTAVQTDVAKTADMNALFEQIERSGAPLRGVVHSAGVLDDGVLLDQTWSRVQHVMQPKLGGAWQLHRLTRNLNLDFFVLFSAGAAVLGSPGQAGYCAANLSLDAVAQARRSAGLPATSIAWGPWADGGMAASMSERDASRWRDRGVASLSTIEGLSLLEASLEGVDTAVAALAMDWKRFSAAGPQRSRFDRLAIRQGPKAVAAPEAQGQLLARIEESPPAERRNVLAAFLRQQARLALGIDGATELDERRPLKELGLDSLMAVELRNALVAAVGKPMPVTLLFDFPTLAALGDYLGEAVLKLEARAPHAAAESGDAARHQTQVAAVARLSDAEAEALLLAELGSGDPQE